MCLRCLHLFAYSFNHVIRVHYVASIHLRGRHEHKKWKIGLCSTFRVQKCLCFIKYKCKGWITVCFQDLGTLGQLFVSMWQHLWQRHPAGTWAIHPKICWIEGQNTYYIMQTNWNWRNMKSIPPTIWMTSSTAHFRDSPLRNSLCWQLFVTWKPHPEHDLRIHHLPHLWLRWFFFDKIGNIFLHHLVALSSCNTRIEGEKWELSQLEYSGEMQVLQKDFDMEKTYVDALWTKKAYTEYRKTHQSSMLIQDVPFLRNFNHKTYLSYI